MNCPILRTAVVVRTISLRAGGAILLVLFTGILCAPALAENALVVTGTSVRDNGDDDGWADSLETVELSLRVRNRSGEDLGPLLVMLRTEDDKIACLQQATSRLDFVAAGEEVWLAVPFVFRVADVQRADVFEDFAAEFEVRVVDAAGSPLTVGLPLALPLDLDATGGTGATTWFESFEDGLGAFEPMHLDEDLNPPVSDPGNDLIGVLNSDGYRCKDTDPARSCTFGFCPWLDDCYPGSRGLLGEDIFHFQSTDNRAYGGTYSLYYGIELAPALGLTTPIGQLEAVRVTDPIHLAWQRTCSISSIPCTTDAACSGGESCVLPDSVLSFKQQVDFVGHDRIGSIPERHVIDRAIVQIQLAAPDGTSEQPWIKLGPFLNGHESGVFTDFTFCFFDPIDDGNDEDTLFYPVEEPYSSGREGPSSTCPPERVFGQQGDTSEPFAPEAIGDAPDGPGLPGSSGVGTWVESRYDLSGYRGRSLRLRFLATGSTLGGGAVASWEEAFAFNPTTGDDGWFVDDVAISGVLADAATLIADVENNTALPGFADNDSDGLTCDNCPDTANPGQADRDGDGVGDACDACPDEPADDADGDGLCCPADNCCAEFNPGQSDGDGDGVGDACDNCPTAPNPEQDDTVHPGGAGDACDDPDGDGIVDSEDLCPDVAWPVQIDSDGDGVGNRCDTCPFVADPAQEDADGDAVGDLCDSCSFDANILDIDSDGIDSGCDNCVGVPNPDQADGDGDGVGDACDNCPLSVNTSQADADDDGTGDACEPCPAGDGTDGDADGVFCSVDSCPDVFNPDQIDLDDDGLGEPCDACPADPANDADRDGVCGDVDNCRTRFNADQSAAILLSVGLDDSDRLADHRLLSSGEWVVYQAPYYHPRELWSVASTGGAPVRLHPVPSTFTGIERFRVAPGETSVWFTADLFDMGGARLFKASLDGAELAGVGPAGTVFDFAFSPDGNRVVLLADVHGDGHFELYRAGADGSDLKRISQEIHLGGSVASFAISPDATRVVFNADALGEGEVRLYSVPIDGGAVTSLTVNPGSQSDYSEYAFSADGSTIVYLADEEVPARHELFAVPVTGGDRVKISPPVNPGDDVRGFTVAPSGNQVVFYIKRSGILDETLWSGTLDGNPPVQLSSDFDFFQITPDGSTVVFRYYGLWTVTLDGSPAIRLDVPPAGSAGSFALTPEGSTVVFGDRTSPVLWVVSLEGGIPEARSLPVIAVASGGLWIGPQGQSVFYTTEGEGTSGERLYVVPIDGGNSMLLNGDSSPAGDLQIVDLQFDDRESVVAYRVGRRNLPNSVEDLFAALTQPEADGDGDGVLAQCDCNDESEVVTFPGAVEVNDGLDNQCPGEAGFGLVDELAPDLSFGSTAGALMSWSAQAGAILYGGIRATDPTFETGCSSFSPIGVPYWIDVESPPPGVTFHFLVRVTAPFPGSWGADSSGQERSIACP